MHSDYVLSEAERARTAHKLIQLRSPDLDAGDLPPPFDTMHAALIDDRNAIYGALAKLGVLRDEKMVPGDSRPPFNWRSLSTRRKLSPLVLAALASVIALGAVWTMISFRAKPTSGPTLQSADRGTTVAKRFLDDLNAGLRDSSLFDADVRLGQLGQMSRVGRGDRTSEAFGPLRRNPLPHRQERRDAQGPTARTKRATRTNRHRV